MLEFTWQGEHDQQLRASFSIRDGAPVIHELAARKSGGNWVVLGHDLSPEYQVTSGKRRLSEQQMAPLRKLKIAFTPDVVEREKWYRLLGRAVDDSQAIPGTSMDLPRKPEEIRRATAVLSRFGMRGENRRCAYGSYFSRAACDLGIFAGGMRYTVYRGKLTCCARK